jgi:hypothetical protein
MYTRCSTISSPSVRTSHITQSILNRSFSLTENTNLFAAGEHGNNGNRGENQDIHQCRGSHPVPRSRAPSFDYAHAVTANPLILLKLMLKFQTPIIIFWRVTTTTDRQTHIHTHTHTHARTRTPFDLTVPHMYKQDLHITTKFCWKVRPYFAKSLCFLSKENIL